jgi:hypothetical protein
MRKKSLLIFDILYQTLTDLDMDAIALSSTVDNRAHNLKLVGDLDQASTFPQWEVIVHHGGAGSASQSIHSGRPGVTVTSIPKIWVPRLKKLVQASCCGLQVWSGLGNKIKQIYWHWLFGL